jgi:hypothetical protein
MLSRPGPYRTATGTLDPWTLLPIQRKVLT